jgi:hypothetical protein
MLIGGGQETVAGRRREGEGKWQRGIRLNTKSVVRGGEGPYMSALYVRKDVVFEDLII